MRKCIFQMPDDLTYQKGDLFLRGPNWEFNACVGRNGGYYTYHDYACGYFYAARLQVEAVFNGDGLLDILVYPTIYLYRHALELSMKGLIRRLKKNEDKDEDFPKTHKLLKLWDELELTIKPLRKEFDGGADLLVKMRTLICDLDLLDSSSEVFRFPESRKGDIHLLDRTLINYERLKPLASAENVFDYWNQVVSEFFEAEFESFGGENA